MAKFSGTLGMIFLLIFTYLLLSHPTATSKTISSLGSSAKGLIKTLQGR